MLEGVTPLTRNHSKCLRFLPSFWQGYNRRSAEPNVAAAPVNSGAKHPSPCARLINLQIQTVAVTVAARLLDDEDLPLFKRFDRVSSFRYARYHATKLPRSGGAISCVLGHLLARPLHDLLGDRMVEFTRAVVLHPPIGHPALAQDTQRFEAVTLELRSWIGQRCCCRRGWCAKLLMRFLQTLLEIGEVTNGRVRSEAFAHHRHDDRWPITLVEPNPQAGEVGNVPIASRFERCPCIAFQASQLAVPLGGVGGALFSSFLLSSARVCFNRC